MHECIQKLVCSVKYLSRVHMEGAICTVTSASQHPHSGQGTCSLSAVSRSCCAWLRESWPQEGNDGAQRGRQPSWPVSGAASGRYKDKKPPTHPWGCTIVGLHITKMEHREGQNFVGPGCLQTPLSHFIPGRGAPCGDSTCSSRTSQSAMLSPLLGGSGHLTSSNSK